MDCLRGGKRGGGIGLTGCWPSWPVLDMFVGGGSTPSLLEPFGSFPRALLCVRVWTGTLAD